MQEPSGLTCMGKLCGVYINRYNLSAILQLVSLELLTGLSMIIGLTVEDMYMYVATGRVVAMSKNILLFLDISPTV